MRLRQPQRIRDRDAGFPSPAGRAAKRPGNRGRATTFPRRPRKLRGPVPGDRERGREVFPPPAQRRSRRRSVRRQQWLRRIRSRGNSNSKERIRNGPQEPGNRKLSERIHKFNGKQAGFLGQILSAGPVVAFGGLMRLGEKAADFLREVLLRGVELPATCLLEVLFRNGDVVVRLALVTRLIARRELRRNLRSGRARSFRGLIGRFRGRLLRRGLMRSGRRHRRRGRRIRGGRRSIFCRGRRFWFGGGLAFA